jgi:hypothetical protein
MRQDDVGVLRSNEACRPMEKERGMISKHDPH